MSSSPIQISLFATLSNQMRTVFPVFRASKATLVDISHTLEDCILVNKLPSVIFTGFQESSHWRAETQRYLDLAGIASQVCIFAGGNPPVPEERHIAIVTHLERRYNQQRAVVRELEQARLYEQRLERVLAELATPVIPILEEVIVLPLIGAIDTRRAQLIMENLLQGIADFQATVAIIDITGVPVVDTAVADTLMRAVKAASLLGARVILSGISARIALTLVSLGLDMSHVLTCGQLRDSIMTALELRGLQIVPLANC